MLRSALVAILLSVSFAGCAMLSESRGDGAESDEQGVAASAPDAPVSVRLDVEDARAFFAEGTNATLTVRGASASDVRAGVALPEDVDLVDGELSYEGALQSETPVVLRGVLRAASPGEHVLRAWAEVPMGVGSRAAPAALLAVIGDADEARFEERELPARAFSVTLAPSDDLRSVTMTIASDVEASARVDWLVPEVFRNGAAGGQDYALAANGSETREIALGDAERWGEGAYAVTAYLAPDPAVDGRIYSAALYYWWEGDTLRVGASAPGGASPGGSGPGASSGGAGAP